MEFKWSSKYWTGWWQLKNFSFSPRKLRKIPILTNIFQMGWNHQPVNLYFLFWFLMSVRCWGVCSGRPYNFGLWPRWNYAFILIAQLQKNAVQCRFLSSNLLQGLSYRRLASTHYVVSWASSDDQTLQVELHVFSTDERTLKNKWTSFIISALRRYVGYKIPTDILMLEVSIFNNSTKCLVELSATLPETNSSPLKMGDPWKRRFRTWKPPIFRGETCEF